MTIDWAKVYEKLYGHPVTQPGPDAIDAVIEKAAEEVADLFLEKARFVLKQVTEESRQPGMPPDAISRILALMNAGEEFWPSMNPVQAQGLDFAVSILKDSGDFPYKMISTDPVPERDPSVDAAIMNLGTWGQTRLLGKLFEDYAKVIERYQGAFAEAMPVIPEGSEGAILNIYLRRYVELRPHNYHFGHLTRKGLALMFG